MKVANKLVRWNHEPWTVVQLEEYGEDGKRQAIVAWYAFNTRTGERRPGRNSYDAAMADIPGYKSDDNPHAEPWGV